MKYVSGRIVRGKYIWLGLERGSGRANRKFTCTIIFLSITILVITGSRHLITNTQTAIRMRLNLTSHVSLKTWTHSDETEHT